MSVSVVEMRIVLPTEIFSVDCLEEIVVVETVLVKFCDALDDTPEGVELTFEIGFVGIALLEVDNVDVNAALPAVVTFMLRQSL